MRKKKKTEFRSQKSECEAARVILNSAFCVLYSAFHFHFKIIPFSVAIHTSLPAPVNRTRFATAR